MAIQEDQGNMDDLSSCLAWAVSFAQAIFLLLAALRLCHPIKQTTHEEIKNDAHFYQPLLASHWRCCLQLTIFRV